MLKKREREREKKLSASERFLASRSLDCITCLPERSVIVAALPGQAGGWHLGWVPGRHVVTAPLFRCCGQKDIPDGRSVSLYVDSGHLIFSLDSCQCMVRLSTPCVMVANQRHGFNPEHSCYERSTLALCCKFQIHCVFSCLNHT